MKIVKAPLTPEARFLVNKARNEAEANRNLVAVADIPKGKYFTVGSRCFQAVAAIINGETITPGQNCEEINIAEALNTLNKEGE